MFEAIAALSLMGAGFGAALGFAARRFRVDGDPVADEINALLPQTQCAQCGYPGCRPYAEAIAANQADINRCAPGGEATIANLAALLDRPSAPLDAHYGEHKAPAIAVIDESRCIGCALCLKACPVDAIVGAQHYMHTVIEDECTGCELCLAPCPVDCIALVEAG